MFSCERTIQKELSAFDQNIENLDKIAAKYPNFKNACNTLKGDGSIQMESAKKLKEEKSKLEGMSAANQIISPSWVSNLLELENVTKRVEEKVNNVSILANAKNDENKLITSRKGESALRSVKTLIEDSEIRNSSDADAIVNEVIGILKRTESDMNQELGVN